MVGGSLLVKHHLTNKITIRNGIGGVMVIVLASSAIDRGFEPQSIQIKDYKIGVCCFSSMYVA